MDVTESDHKPVRCKFDIDIAHVDRSMRRQEFGKILESNVNIKKNVEALRFVPETIVNTNKIVLQNLETSSFKITNRSGEDSVFFQIFCEGQSNVNEKDVASDFHPRGSLGFPRWLEVFITNPIWWYTGLVYCWLLLYSMRRGAPKQKSFLEPCFSF